MIRFVLTRGHGYTLRSVKKSPLAPTISVMNYDALIRARWLRRATYIFTDVDRLSHWDLEMASHIYLEIKKTGLAVWNNPARTKNRYALLRALHTAGLNDFNVYRVDELSAEIRFPVFVRKLHGHREPLSDLLATRSEMEKAIDAAIATGTPAENLLVVEFAAEPVRPGLYRKLSAFRIGHAIIPHISVHDDKWLVKYGTTGIAGDELYREEQSLVQTNPFAEHLKQVFDIAQIEYGRADFGFYRGRIQVYEINTNPMMESPDVHPSPVRMASKKLVWENYLNALRALDSDDGRPIRLEDGKLQRHRPWKNLFIRTRKVH